MGLKELRHSCGGHHHYWVGGITCIDWEAYGGDKWDMDFFA